MDRADEGNVWKLSDAFERTANPVLWDEWQALEGRLSNFGGRDEGFYSDRLAQANGARPLSGRCRTTGLLMQSGRRGVAELHRAVPKGLLCCWVVVLWVRSRQSDRGKGVHPARRVRASGFQLARMDSSIVVESRPADAIYGFDPTWYCTPLRCCRARRRPSASVTSSSACRRPECRRMAASTDAGQVVARIGC